MIKDYETTTAMAIDLVCNGKNPYKCGDYFTYAQMIWQLNEDFRGHYDE